MADGPPSVPPAVHGAPVTSLHQRRLFFAVAAGLLTTLPAFRAFAQDPVARVTGRVTGEAGQPLAAASVFLQGTTIGAQTNPDGQYTVLVPAAHLPAAPATLAVRRLGYKAASKPVTLVVGQTATVDFALETASVQLSTVVVTGAGTVTTQEKLGNAISTVKGEELTRSHETNVVNALAAKAPGVQVTSQSGDPGASAHIEIRGASTIQGSGQPLFVIDGVPVDNTTLSTGDLTASTVATNRIADINPADIESMEILKGAAAAAIYGARAAQGVVLITTKTGHAGKTQYSLRSTYSVDQVTQGPSLQRRFGQGIEDTDPTSDTYGQYFSGVCGGPGCRLTNFTWGAPLAAGTPTYDHFAELFRAGHLLDNTLTISGGNERSTFYLSAGRSGQTGVFDGPNNYYDKTMVRLKGSLAVNDRLRLGGNVAYTDARGAFTQKGSNVSGLMLGALRTPPEFDQKIWLDPATGLHRSYRYPQPLATSTDDTRGYDNPFFVLNENPATSTVGHTTGNVSADWTALPWLTVKENLGLDYANDERLEGFAKSSSTAPTGQVTQATFLNYQIDHNLTATAQKDFSADFAGSLTLGQNLNSRSFHQNFATGYDMLAPEPFLLNNTQTVLPTEYQSLIHTESYFGQATADLWNQLYLTAALRNDGFSTFGASERRHWFPKVSGAWTFTNRFPALTSALDYGKVRLAYGVAGQEPAVYQTLGGYSTGALFDDGWGGFLNPYLGGQGGYLSGTVKGQQNLKPEQKKEVEAGIDLGARDGLADLSVTFYNARSEDVIFLTPLAPSTGYLAQAQNAATIRNRGEEVSLNLHPLRGEKAAWDIGLNWAHNDNRVLDLSGAEYVGVSGSFTDPLAVAQKGSRVGVLRGTDFARCGISDAIDVGGGKTVGDFCAGAPKGALYLDANGFPILDPTDRVIMDPTPKWTGSLSSQLTLNKHWTLSGLLDVKRGGQVWNGTRAMLTAYGTAKETEIRGQTRTFGTDYYQGPVAGPGVNTPVVIGQDWFTDLGGGFGPSKQFVESGGFVKLRELSLGYTLDQPWVTRLTTFSSVDLRVAGRNLWTWTRYRGIDPETNLGGAEVQLQGIDYFNNPQTRSFVFSVNLNR